MILSNVLLELLKTTVSIFCYFVKFLFKGNTRLLYTIMNAVRSSINLAIVLPPGNMHNPTSVSL